MGDRSHATETFPKFKARLQNAAIQGKVHDSEWFRYMWNKLTPQLRSASAMGKLQWDDNGLIMVRQLNCLRRETKKRRAQSCF